jgi:hypothetical protein
VKAVSRLDCTVGDGVIEFSTFIAGFKESLDIAATDRVINLDSTIENNTVVKPGLDKRRQISD